MAKRQLVPAAGGAGLRLKRGQKLRVIDPEGGQTGDLMAFSQDGRERLSTGRTFDYGGKIYVSTGDVLWSDRSNRMLTIVSDEIGRHDFLYSPCSIEMYRIQYGVSGYHANCIDNLSAALGIWDRAGAVADRAQSLHERGGSWTEGAWCSRRPNPGPAIRSSCAPRWTSRSRCRSAPRRPATAARRRGRSRLKL